jgi:ABC-type multidrug transport system fused ATPase/permease subunit
VGSGLLYAGLIVIWGVYFIPRWLRRHDELSESRSIEKFDNAMRILSRREATPDRRYVVMPPRPAEPHRPRESPATSRTGRPAARTSRPVTPVSSVTFRRRRILAGLLLVTLVVSVLVPLTVVPWWAPVLAVTVVVAYLVHCRLQARTRHQVTRTRAAVQKRSMSRLMRFDAIERLMTVRREMAEERVEEERRWQEAEAAEARLREEEERHRVEAEAGWSPVPVPLPTYVSKPVARYQGRASSIDLGDPSTWSTTRTEPSETTAPTVPAQTQHAEPAPSTAALDHLLADAAEADEELDAIITRRAVND